MTSIHRDLYIKVPRRVKGVKGGGEYWKLVRKHGTSRKAMVAFITGIGGYTGHHARAAIEFNVKAYNADLSVENLWKLVTSADFDEGPDPKLPPEHLAQVKALFWRVYEEHKDHLWEWSIEEAYEGWRDSDTPYETFVGERVDWTFELHGRGGGHLCMTKCEGLNLWLQSPEDLEQDLLARDPDGSYTISHKQVRSLFIICVQNSVDLTPEKVSEEVNYRGAWRLWVSFCEDEVDGVIKEYEDRQRLSEDAGIILNRIQKENPDEVDSLLAIFKLADIKVED